MLTNPEFKTAIAKFGVEPKGTGLDDGAAALHAEYDMWKKVIAEADIKLQ